MPEPTCGLFHAIQELAKVTAKFDHPNPPKMRKKYYHSKVEDISAIDVKSIFDDLCTATNWNGGEYYSLVAWKWLALFLNIIEE